jgi:hypothetical protein
MRVGSLLALVACSVACWLLAAAGVHAATSLAEGDQINVAVQIWAIDEPAGLYPKNISDIKPWRRVNSTAHRVLQPLQLAWDLYIKKMRARAAASVGGVNLPLPSGVNVAVNFYLVNIADVRPATNEPHHVVSALLCVHRTVADRLRCVCSTPLHRTSRSRCTTI